MLALRPLTAAVIALFAPAAGFAATITVDTTASGINDADGFCSLHEAIQNANSNTDNDRTGSGECVAGSGSDTIVLPSAQTITLTSALATIAGPLSITGNGTRIERDDSVPCTLGAPDPGRFRLLLQGASGSQLNLSDLTLANGCGANGPGGAISIGAGNLVLDHVTLENNSASGAGGAVYAGTGSGSITISNSTLRDNYSAVGGGIASFAKLTLIDSVVEGNSAGGSGGGIYLYLHVADAGSTITGSVVAGNTGALSSSQPGIGLYQTGGELTIENSTFDGNRSDTTGGAGAIGLFGGGTLSLTGVTIADSGSTDPQIRASSSTLSVTRSIISDGSSACSLSSSTLSGSDNLATDSSCDALGATVVSSSDLALGALADNGGPTYTRLPGPGSVAVDAASGCSGLDQRGEARDVDADGSTGSDCDIGAVEVQNTAPTVVADSASTDQDSNVSGNVLGNDSDVAADEDSDLAVVAVDGVTGNVGNPMTPAAGGTLTVAANGAFTFAPGADFLSLDSGDSATVNVAVSVSDGYATKDANLSIEVSGINDVPTAAAVSGSIGESDAAATFAFAGSDPDSGETLSYAFTGAPSAGVVTNLGNGTFSFDPNGEFEALDVGFSSIVTLGYTVSDGDLTSASGSIEITVIGSNDAPVAGDLALTTSQNSSVGGSVSASDPESDPLVYTPASAPAQGTAGIASNGSVSFDPGSDFDDLDDGESRQVSFDYRVTDDSGASDIGTITVTVSGINDAPVAADVAAHVGEDAAAVIAFDASDVDDEPLSYTLVGAPSAGSAVNNGDGSFTFNAAGAFDDLDDGESRDVSFHYTANDGSVDSAQATVTITVDGANDAPLAVDDGYSIVSGQTLAVSAAEGLLANDSDVDGDGLSVVSGTYTPAGIGGTLILASDGGFAYLPPADTTGTAHFTYTVSDGTTTSTATLEIDVIAGNLLDLQISKSDGVDHVQAGEVLTYTINVFNAGPANAVGARVQDLLPAALGNAAWSCEAVPPSAATACSSASGSGDIDQTVNVGAGDAVVFELMTTLAADYSDSTVSNTATVAAPDGFTDSNSGNNSATDVDRTDRVFADSFETTALHVVYAKRSTVLDSEAISAKLPLDAGLRAQLVARADDPNGLLRVHARRGAEGGIELRISRYENGEWMQGAWQPVISPRVQLVW
ncbi:Ig-like domain-containing protein [Pseudomarimonas arenosa]|uniref:Tandem-95 repeat protein n=1 Tax=Pseudomarimonas arenosa TaxID=2774145 RepID=A0AAW3ZMW2_9GAMM|nr:Ig-like domain-containing protein [Pseudomarimonas arenosa]MBD8527416.1 tandem-95 repeat protein [Pseudomarimonas arenosa]